MLNLFSFSVRSAALLRHIPLLLLLACCALPLIGGLLYAFAYSTGLTGLLSQGFTLKHWAGLFQGVFGQSLWFSAAVACASLTLALALAFGLLAMAQSLWEKPFWYRALHLPLAVPPVVAAFVSYQLLSGSGLLSRMAWQAGLIGGPEDFPEWVQDRYAIAMVLSHALMAFPVLLASLLNQLHHAQLPALAQLAATLGAGKKQIVLRVQAPVLLRGILPLSLLYGVFFFGAYEIPLLLGRSSPRMVSLLIVDKLQRYNLQEIPVAYAMALWYALGCLLALGLVFRAVRPASA